MNKIISIVHRKTQDLIYADLLGVARCAFAIPRDSNYFDAYLDSQVHRMIDIIIHTSMELSLKRIEEVLKKDESS